LDCVAKQQAVIVDLSGVSYIDSSGVASLVEAYQTARKGETSFALANVSQAAMRVLELARLDKVFTIHDSLVDGLKHAG
jgi:anti-sigma B factor antagonist